MKQVSGASTLKTYDYEATSSTVAAKYAPEKVLCPSGANSQAGR